jgi:hypothetical protein
MKFLQKNPKQSSLIKQQALTAVFLWNYLKRFYFSLMNIQLGQTHPSKECLSMWKFFGTLAILVVLYSIFFDLKYGTLPAKYEEPKSISAASSAPHPFFEETVQAGDTVLSIVENKLNAQIPVSINEVVEDFKKLNAGITPEKIQIGKIYRFPDYIDQ